MKKVTAGLVLIMFLALGASAQEKRGSHHGKYKAKHHRQHITKDLNLSEDQKQKMQAARDDYRKQMSDLNKNENLTVKEMRDRKASLAKEHKAAMDGILTQEQKNKIQEQRNQAIEKRKEMQAKRSEKMKKDLALTDDQSAKLKTLNENYKNQFESIRKDESMDRTAKQEKFKALHLQQKEELKSVLTPEQIQKMNEMKKDRGGRKQVK